jgi:hypothetical protein
MELFVYFFHLANVVLILVMLVIVLFSVKKYNGVIGIALTYLTIGIVINALLSVTELLERAVEFSSFERIGGIDYADLVRSAFVAFAFCMLAAGFYKLSKIYKRM